MGTTDGILVKNSNMAKSSPKEYTFHWEDSKPIQFDLHAPSTYSPSISTYKALILYHSGGLVSANRRVSDSGIRTSLVQKELAC